MDVVKGTEMSKGKIKGAGGNEDVKIEGEVWEKLWKIERFCLQLMSFGKMIYFNLNRDIWGEVIFE